MVVIWAAAGSLALVLGHAVAWPRAPHISRLAGIYPALAILEATFLIWLCKAAGFAAVRGGTLLNIAQGEEPLSYQIQVPGSGRGSVLMLLSLVRDVPDPIQVAQRKLLVGPDTARIKPLDWITCGQSETGLYRIPLKPGHDATLTLTVSKAFQPYAQLNAVLLEEGRAP